MWFRKVTAGAFGRLRDETLRLGGALNIVYGPNESGKSTWHAALTVALCGLRHGSGRTNVERDFKRRRQPWDDPDRWHVNLEVELDDGRIIEIDRDLNDARTTTLDVGMGGREVTDDLMNQGSPDGAKWLGLDRTTFPMTASVNQADVLSILDLGNNERHALQEHLAQAAAGGRGGTAAGAIECIRKFAAENVGADRRNARKPLRLAMNSVERAESQLSRTRERRQEYVGLVRRVDRNRRMVRVLESRQAALRALLARDEAEERANHLVKRVTRLEEWESRFFDGDPRALGEARSAELVIALSGARNAPESVETDLEPLEVLENRLRQLEQQKELVEAFEGLEEPEKQADELRSEFDRLQEWESRFFDGDPRALGEARSAELVIALSGARNAPESVETDLEPLEVLEGRLEELGRQRELVVAVEGLEEAEGRAEELERDVARLEEWEQRFLDVEPRNRELMSVTDIASAVARCNSLPTPGFTDIDPMEILEERIAMLNNSSPKPCPSPGDVQRWVIPLRETPLPPQHELLSEMAEVRSKKAPPKTGSSAWRRTLSAVIGVTAAGGVWMVTTELLYGVMTGVVVALGMMFLRPGSSTDGTVASVDIKSLERQLRERETFDARVAEAHLRLREWELPVDPDAAIAEFYNRERALSEQTTERRRLEEMITRRRRFDEGEAQRHAERESAFGELRKVVALYGGDVSGDEGQILGKATSLLNDLQRVARELQQDAAEWGRFQEALANRSVEEWRDEAKSARQDAEQATRTAQNVAAKVGGELLGMEDIRAEYAVTVGLVSRRRRFDDEAARRSAERVQAFQELRRVVVLYGGDGSGDEAELLRVADGLLERFERLAEERRGDIAEWGRFQEALGGRSMKEWEAEVESAHQDVELARYRADSLATGLEVAPMRLEDIEAEYAVTVGLVSRRRRFDDEAARRSAERVQAFQELRRVVVLYGGDGSGDEGELLRVADGLLERFERLAEERRGDIAEWGRFQEALAGRPVEEWRVGAAYASREAKEATRRADELAAGLEEELQGSDNTHAALRETDRQLRDARTEANRTAGQLEQIDTDGVDVAMAKAALDEAKNELDGVQRLQRTLDTAREHLQRAAEHAHRLLAPRLETLMKEWIPIITDGRYVGVFVDPETLEVKLRHRDGMIREAALLSHGTAEQVYLLLRMILAQVLTDGHETCPVLLDDPTVHADPRRKEQVLEYLFQASKKHQVILFTQDHLVLQWARARCSNQNVRSPELLVHVIA